MLFSVCHDKNTFKAEVNNPSSTLSLRIVPRPPTAEETSTNISPNS